MRVYTSEWEIGAKECRVRWRDDVRCEARVGTEVENFFFFSSRRRHTRYWRDWSSDVCSSDLDGLLHIQRLVALAQMTRDGVPVSRWVPDLAYGYGQPLFNYYAPLAYGPSLLAHLAGLDVASSFELATAFWLVLSAFAMYALGRALFGPVPALTAALVYVSLPYQLVDVYVRGALAETAAFSWLPLVAACLVLARRDGRARWSVGLALSVTGLVLTHNITALIAVP